MEGGRESMGGADGGLIRGRESKEEGGLRRGTLKSRVGQ